MSELYRVLRDIGRPGVAVGDIVDASDWRWRRQLVERRMLAPVPIAVDVAAVQDALAAPLDPPAADADHVSPGLMPLRRGPGRPPGSGNRPREGES